MEWTDSARASADLRSLPDRSDGDAEILALVDDNRFSQECLGKAFEASLPGARVRRFASARDLLVAEPAGLGCILYHAHGGEARQKAELGEIAALRAGFPGTPLLVLAGAEDMLQPRTTRRMLAAGALGVVPTRTSGIGLSLAAMRLVQAGGIFVPPAILDGRAEPADPPPGPRAEAGPLSARQSAVLGHLARGHANKLIACELGISESTVKVHVRNIMRRLKATNRTQAVYKARERWGEAQQSET